MSKKKNNRKGEIKMMNEEIKNEEPVVEEVNTTVSNEGVENVTVEDIDVNNETITEEVQEVIPGDPEVKPEELEVEPMDDDHTGENDEIKDAIVTGCKLLNVRKEASKTAEVVCVVADNTELTVNITKSTDDFYKVYTTNNDVLVEGYCAKNFIKIK